MINLAQIGIVLTIDLVFIEEIEEITVRGVVLI